MNAFQIVKCSETKTDRHFNQANSCGFVGPTVDSDTPIWIGPRVVNLICLF